MQRERSSGTDRTSPTILQHERHCAERCCGIKQESEQKIRREFHLSSAKNTIFKGKMELKGYCQG